MAPIHLHLSANRRQYTLHFILFINSAKNSTNNSLHNTSLHALFLLTSRESKYKSKAAIDSFFWRAGDALSALLVFMGTRLAFNARDFAIVNAAFVLGWLFVAVAIVRYRTDQKAAPSEVRQAA